MIFVCYLNFLLQIKFNNCLIELLCKIVSTLSLIVRTLTLARTQMQCLPFIDPCLVLYYP